MSQNDKKSSEGKPLPVVETGTTHTNSDKKPSPTPLPSVDTRTNLTEGYEKGKGNKS